MKLHQCVLNTKFVFYKLNVNDFNILICHFNHMPNKFTLKVHTSQNVRAP